MTCHHLFSVLFFCCCLQASAQNDSTQHVSTSNDWSEKRLGLIAGYNGVGYQYTELGVGYGERGISDRHPYVYTLFASCEMRLDGHQNIFAPKLGLWLANGSAFGLNLLYYTGSQHKGMPCFRPEIGLGMSFFKLVYGYNLAFINKDFNGINRHNLNLVFLIRVVKLKTKTFH